MATQHINQKGVTRFLKSVAVWFIAALVAGSIPQLAFAGDILLGTEADEEVERAR